MNTQPKPCSNKRCKDCGVVYREAGDVKIRLAHSRPTAPGKAGEGKCPQHDEHGGGGE